MISSWMFYTIDILESIEKVLFFFGSMSFIVMIMFLVVLFYSYSEDKPKTLALSLRILTHSSIICIATQIIGIFIPSTQTMYMMLAVSYFTPENIEILRSFGIETIQQLGDVIADSINKIKEAGR